MSTPAPASSSRRQKRMGPAPFASFEDLSDELESPEDKNVAGSVVRLPGIREDLTPTTPAMTDRSPSPSYPSKGISLIGTPAPNTTTSLSPNQTTKKNNIRAPATPRIDISRASSSSHHDSKDSSPEREIYDTHDPNSAKLGLGFKEDGALDLRSSTEELDFQEMTVPERRRSSSKVRPSSPSILEEPLPTRKDSQCSDIVLLSISGRTSRLSSIGSQGSGQSRLSNASHISVLSGQSGLSRCSSPHKMLLETSFIGIKTTDNAEKVYGDHTGTKVESEVMEKILLSRKHDPTEAILAEGILVDKAQPLVPKTQPEKPARKKEINNSQKSDITITVDKPETESNNTDNKIKSRFVSESGIEYYYIPLKGPLPPDLPKAAQGPQFTKSKLREVKSANYQSRTAPNKSKVPESKPRCKSATPTPTSSITKKEEATTEMEQPKRKVEAPKYIRIKLKPDNCYSETSPTHEIYKPDSLELDLIQKTDESIILDKNIRQIQESNRIYPAASNGSPKILTGNIETVESVTPSPSISRRSSFASLFKNKDAVISPESPSVPGSSKRKHTISGILKEAGDNLRTRSRSRSKSRDRESHKSSLSTAPSSTESIDTKSKHKSVLSLFKSTKKDKLKSESETGSQETLRSSEGIGKLEFKFNESKYYENPLDCATIRIPLHSPTYYENKTISDWKTSSQDSQETVIENVCRNVNVVVEKVQPHQDEIVEKKIIQKSATKPSRQNSTSSENIVFSTKLGSDNEVFTTKLPKKIPNEKSSSEESKKTEVVNGVHDPKLAVQKLQQQGSLETTKEPQKISRESSKEKITRLQNVEEPQKTNSIHSLKSIESKHTENETTLDKRISQVSTISSAPSSTADDHYSSESEKEVEETSKSKNDLKLELDISEPERKAIVLQQDSFEDELPYIPTTLPLERSAALPIVPVKQRSTFEVKTCPIERPRSTTPINPSCLDEYCEEVMGTFNVESVTKMIEKLKISLPRNESFDKVKSPRKKDSNTNWFEFAEKGITKSTPNETPPPLPPKGIQKSWINFENIPEKRKVPKRIQTIPSRSYIEVPESVLQENVVYNYVNPDECKCECHEINAKERERRVKESQEAVQEDEMPLLEDENADDDKAILDCSDRVKLDVTVSDCRSIISDSSVDLSTNIDPHEIISTDPSLRTPFTSDLGLSSNRSSVVSQDDHQSPESPNAFPRIS